MEMIPYGRHHIDESDIQAVVDCLRSDFLTQGPKVAEFEKAVALAVGARFAVAVTSGTAALHLAALASGASSDSSLITSPITFVASANAGLYLGAKPLFVDINPETINLSVTALEKKLKEYVQEGDVVLIKGARAFELEHILKGFETCSYC